MRSITVTALAVCSFSSVAHAQAAPAAAAASVAASAPEPTVLQVQTPPSPPTADSSGSDDFVNRYKPQDNLWEAAAFLGPLFISDKNGFRGPTVVNAGRPPTVMPLSTFKQPSIEIGVRGGHLLACMPWCSYPTGASFRSPSPVSAIGAC